MFIAMRELRMTLNRYICAMPGDEDFWSLAHINKVQLAIKSGAFSGGGWDERRWQARDHLAEAVRFELTVGVNPRQFSRL